MGRLIGAQCLRVDGNIYTVVLVDSEFGSRQFSILVSPDNIEFLEQILADIHDRWSEKGNTPPQSLPPITVESINAAKVAIAEAKVQAEAAKIALAKAEADLEAEAAKAAGAENADTEK
jgi:hypothetical protein